MDQFLSQFFPTLAPTEIQALEAQYADLGSNFSQAVSIVGECKSGIHISYSRDLKRTASQLHLSYLPAFISVWG